MKKILLQLFISINFLLFFYNNGLAGSVDTVSILSKSMGKEIKCVIIKPGIYRKKKNRFPVVYLLHGYSGNYSNWIIKLPELKKYADDFSMIIVCPDGGYSSWYFDSKMKSSSLYETYVGVEVPKYIDMHYRTLTHRESRAITGLSMGGHGALYIAWRHPALYGAAGSMSGGVDLAESRNRFAIEQLIGDSAVSPLEWKTHSMINVVETPLSQPLSLIIDCGVNDFFIKGNRRLHQKLLDLQIAHEYIERKGVHNWDYWQYAVHFQLLFFRKYFDAAKLKIKN